LNQPIDERWERLRDHAWTCAECGESHRGILDLGAARPDQWQDSAPALPNSAVAGSSHCLTGDFCILQGQHYFVRCLLSLPLIGNARGEQFSFGVWSSLSPKNFQIYLDTFDDGEQGSLGPWFGWFSNRLAGYPNTLNLKCRVHPQGGRQRPWIELEPTGHPLAVESREGVTYERLLEIYKAHGHTPNLAP
jgi:hypothetical protein